MEESHNHSHFHLHRVSDHKLLGRQPPDRVESEWVNAVWIINTVVVASGAIYWSDILVVLDFVARAEPVVRHGEELVIQQTVVAREEAHHNYHVSQLESELVLRLSLESRRKDAHDGSQK